MKQNTLLEFKKSPDSSLGFQILQTSILRSIRNGRLRVIDVNGGVHDFGDESGRMVCIKFKKPSAYWRLLLNPDLYLGEAYMNEEITIEEGSLLEFLELVLKNIPGQRGFVTPMTSILKMLDRCMKYFQEINTPMKSRENVSHHYDLSYDHYKLFLDQKMQYSCAYFETGKETLEEAQEKKMQYVVNKLLIKPKDHVLDIGCGWGSLARHIARTTGAKVTGVTLSIEQLKYAEKKAEEEGVADLVKFKLCDYRSLEDEYDRIVSVGMFEHVGVDFYKVFFETIAKNLKKDGLALLHSIGRSTVPSNTNPWIKKYIFPGGYIPSISEVVPHVENSGLIITDLEILRLHYAKTLNEWSRRFDAHRETARKIHNERFCRMWEFYLAASEASFKYSGNMVFHMQVSKKQEAVPVVRNYLYN